MILDFVVSYVWGIGIGILIVLVFFIVLGLSSRLISISAPGTATPPPAGTLPAGGPSPILPPPTATAVAGSTTGWWQRRQVSYSNRRSWGFTMVALVAIALGIYFFFPNALSCSAAGWDCADKMKGVGRVIDFFMTMSFATRVTIAIFIGIAAIAFWGNSTLRKVAIAILLVLLIVGPYTVWSRIKVTEDNFAEWRFEATKVPQCTLVESLPLNNLGKNPRGDYCLKLTHGETLRVEPNENTTVAFLLDMPVTLTGVGFDDRVVGSTEAGPCTGNHLSGNIRYFRIKARADGIVRVRINMVPLPYGSCS